MKHGLCAVVCVPEVAEAVQRRATEIFGPSKPRDEVHAWMLDQAALNSLRIDRCQGLERTARDKIALRAELTWDGDRRFEVEILARSLGKDPAATVEALRRTPHGCDWMMKRWAMLAYSADTQPAGWTAEQSKLAFDLLATPATFRDGHRPGVALDSEGRPLDRADDPAAMARREIAALKEQREVVADLDEVDRALASSDLAGEGDPELRRLRRYESALHSRLRWCLKQAAIPSPAHSADPAPRPARAIEPGRKSGLKPGPGPGPLAPTPDAFPGPSPAPEIPPDLTRRQAKRLRMAEERRLMALAKVRKLRA